MDRPLLYNGPRPGIDYQVTLYDETPTLERAAGPWAVKHDLVHVKVSKKSAQKIIELIKPADPDDAMLEMTYFGYPWEYLEEYYNRGGDLNKLGLKRTSSNKSLPIRSKIIVWAKRSLEKTREYKRLLRNWVLGKCSRRTMN